VLTQLRDRARRHGLSFLSLYDLWIKRPRHRGPAGGPSPYDHARCRQPGARCDLHGITTRDRSPADRNGSRAPLGAHRCRQGRPVTARVGNAELSVFAVFRRAGTGAGAGAATTSRPTTASSHALEPSRSTIHALRTRPRFSSAGVAHLTKRREHETASAADRCTGGRARGKVT
jgi:hypothetical protein